MTHTPEHKDYEALLKQSFLSLKKVQARLDAVERAKREPIAIIGIGCRFPGGAGHAEAFWRLLRDQVDTVSEIRPDRWDVDAFYDPDSTAPGKINTRWASFLEHVDGFDAAFFGISHREALWMDPQQRLLLEVAWEALEDAGQPRECVAGSQTGVFVGVCNNDYTHLALADLERIDAYASTGCAHSIVPNRLSYALDLRGPSIAVDTACSSSLVAIHLACQSLRANECKLALTGGVNLVLTPESTISFSKFGMLASDGRCKAFDAAADGFVRGDGCGILVLKRLSDALADGDNILALIRGSAVNQDGHSNGLTAPSGLAQQTAIRLALENAGLAPGQISYIEAHGTGTSLGDPIEVEALASVYGQPCPEVPACVIGSVKANIGHTEATAGVAGVIKTVLALRHETIPGQLHFKELNPNITLEHTRFAIAAEPTPWPSGAEPRRAGVNSFSFGGTNAHVILEEAPRPAEASTEVVAPAADQAYLLPLSAQCPEAIQALARAYRDMLVTGDVHETGALRDLCYTASIRRSHHDHRLAIAASGKDELVEQLDAFLADMPRAGISSGRKPAGQRHKLVFIFPGHGSQWFGMGRTLLAQEPVFRATLEQCAQAMRPYTDWSLLEQLALDERSSRLNEVEVIQPALFAIEVALAALWQSWGIVPDAVVGHSMGEVAAAHVAGILSLGDAARIICRRSQLLARVSGHGAMAAVDLSYEQAQAALAGYEDRLVIALSNSPRSTVLSGDPAALEEVLAVLQSNDVFCRRVNSDVAFHSPQVEPLCADLLQATAGIRPQPATLPIYSTVEGKLRAGEGFDATYWVRNLRQPVLFSQAIQRLLDDGHTIFVELSPHPILLPAVEQGLRQRGRDGIALPSLRRAHDERATLLGSLAALYSRGYPVDWSGLYPDGGRCVSLPLYPWQRERFWIEHRQTTQRGRGKSYLGWGSDTTGHPLLDHHVQSSVQPGASFWELGLNLETAPYLKDHCVRGTVVVPATAYLESVLAAAHTTFGPGAHVLEQVEFKQVLILRDDEIRTVQLVFTPTEADTVSYHVASRPAAEAQQEAPWTVHTTGTVRLGRDVKREAPERLDLAAIQARCQAQLSSTEFYQAMQEVGFEYGPTFRGVERIWYEADEAVARLRLADSVAAETGRYHVHPALLDICFHVLATTKLQGRASLADGETYLPVGLERLEVYGSTDRAAWSHARLHAQTASQEETLEGDVALLDAAGHVVAAAHGLRMQRLNREVRRNDQAGVNGWLYRIAWEAKPLAAQECPSRIARGNWLIFADADGLGDTLVGLLEARGEHCIMVEPGGRYGLDRPGHYQLNPARPEEFGYLLKDAFRNDQPACQGIVYLWGLEALPPVDPTLASLTAAQERGCEGVLNLVQALAHAGWRTEPRLWLVTRATQAVEPVDEPIAIAQASLWGLGRVIAHEHPGLHCTRIDLNARPALGEARMLLAEIDAEEHEDQIALRQETRYVARLVRYTPAGEGATLFRPDGTYLITGGTGGLGLTVAQWMVEQGARHLVLMSRRGVPRSGTAADTALAALAAMHQAGAEVQIATADVAEEAQVARVLSDIDRSLPPLRGIIHAAGVLDDGILLQLNRERFRTTMAPKLDGAWNLHTLTLDKPLDFFVLFSSAASMLGSPGQGNYAAANAFLDGLAHHRRALGRPALSINWGPWADVGLAAQVSQNGQATIGGIAAIPPQQGVEVLGQLLRQEAAQVGVMPLNLRQWRQFYPKAAKSPLLAHLQEQESAAGARKSGHDMRAALLAVEPGERRALLEAHLREEITQVLRIAPSRLDEQTALGSLGLDSLMALELRNRLEDSLELTLPVTLIWNYQTIADLAPHLAEKMGIALDTANDEQPEAGAASQFSDEEREELARVLREFGELSADDLEAVAAL